ncbi:hypothetical protein [Herbiconiux liangxiaofengii]|uniref:hypothetical protein n=1 Tax=Herbiconiux liangxiaofengii TaxID=3342795 RepID=UPI0035B9AB83
MHAPENLSAGARRTLDQIEYHPVTHNLGWHDLVEMLTEVAEVEQHADGAKITVHLGNRKLELTRPEGVPVSEAALLEVRRLFKDAGFM